ncbi:MAG: hypothetical protein ACKOCB_04580 [Planctomycetia bacterium]
MSTSPPPSRSIWWQASARGGVSAAFAGAHQMVGLGSLAPAQLDAEPWRPYVRILRACVGAHVILALRQHMRHEEWLSWAASVVAYLGSTPFDSLGARDRIRAILLQAEQARFETDTDFLVRHATAPHEVGEPCHQLAQQTVGPALDKFSPMIIPQILANAAAARDPRPGAT